MRVLSSRCGLGGDFETIIETAVQLGALGAEMRMCAPPDCAAAEQCAAPVANGVMPTGVRR